MMTMKVALMLGVTSLGCVKSHVDEELNTLFLTPKPLLKVRLNIVRNKNYGIYEIFRVHGTVMRAADREVRRVRCAVRDRRLWPPTVSRTAVRSGSMWFPVRFRSY